MTRAQSILERVNKVHENANNDFSTRIQITDKIGAKELANLKKKILGLVAEIIPDITIDDITTIQGKDRKAIVVNIADVPTSLHDKIDTEVQKAVK